VVGLVSLSWGGASVGDDSGSYTRRHTTEVTLLSEATACPRSVVADTIMRTIELGVRITDTAVDEKVTYDLLCAGGG
jgi:hypothetical protein